MEEVSIERAQQIMGDNLLGPAEVKQVFGTAFTNKEKTQIAKIPFTEEILQKKKDSYILFLGVSRDGQRNLINISYLSKVFPALWAFQTWYEKEELITLKPLKLQWYLIRKEILEESRSKTFSQEQILLRENEYLESLAVYIFCAILFYFARGNKLFTKDWLWCDDRLSNGSHAMLTVADEGIAIAGGEDDKPNPHYGIAPAIKADS